MTEQLTPERNKVGRAYLKWKDGIVAKKKIDRTRDSVLQDKATGTK